VVSVILALLFLMAGCGLIQNGQQGGQQDSAKAIRVAALRGERAGAEKEIELQNKPLAELQARIDATHPGEILPGGGRVLGANPDWFRQKDAIKQRLITLQSQLARIDEEVKSLAPDAAGK
jgi:hypothetical protein